MPSLTVKIVNSGTRVFNEETNQYDSSIFGHMWYSIKESEDSAALSYGFAPVTHGDFDGPGEVKRKDDNNYLFDDDYSYTISIRGSLQEGTKFPTTSLKPFIYLASQGKTNFRIINQHLYNPL